MLFLFRVKDLTIILFQESSRSSSNIKDEFKDPMIKHSHLFTPSPEKQVASFYGLFRNALKEKIIFYHAVIEKVHKMSNLRKMIVGIIYKNAI